MRTGIDPTTHAAALLEARAAALAARTAVQDRRAETTAYLVCACGAERYGLPLAAVAGVVPGRPCTPLPGAPPRLLGIAAMAGVIVSVLDLAACLGGDRAGPAPEGGHVVRLRAAEPPVALAVDRVLGIARIEAVPADTVNPQALGPGPLLGYAPPGSDKTGGVADGFSLVDLPSLLARALV